DPSDRDVPAYRIDPSSLPGRPCSIAAALDLIGDRWSLLAIREVMFGNHRFSQIARNTGAPTDRLAARLKDLVTAGILERRPEPTSRHEGYYLTDAGQELGQAMQPLTRWGDRWAVTEPPMRVSHHGHQVAIRQVCAVCGEEIGTDVTREMTAPGWDATGPTRTTR
ncbi:MAG TPA: helix-turn-helix domain-containing protein, partial [Pseudonocardiaceae bacterium]